MEFKRIELSVPAERSMLLIIRMATAGVMSRAGMTLDEMDDMKMAVDESCNLMMLQKPLCQTLLLEYGYNEQEVEICIESNGICDSSLNKKADPNMQEVIRCILEAIVDEVNILPRSDGSVEKIFLKKRIPNDRRRSVV